MGAYLVEITTLKKEEETRLYCYHSQLEVGHLAIVGCGSDDCGRTGVAECKGATCEPLIEEEILNIETHKKFWRRKC